MDNSMVDVIPKEGLAGLGPSQALFSMTRTKILRPVFAWHGYLRMRSLLAERSKIMYSFIRLYLAKLYGIHDITFTFGSNYMFSVVTIVVAQADKERTKSVHSIPLPKWAFYLCSVHSSTFLHHSIYTPLTMIHYTYIEDAVLHTHEVSISLRKV